MAKLFWARYLFLLALCFVAACFVVTVLFSLIKSRKQNAKTR